MCSIQHFLQSSSSCVIDVTHKPNTLINNQNFIHMTKHLRYLFAVLLVWVCTVGGYAQTTVTDEITWSGLGLSKTNSNYSNFSSKKFVSTAEYAGTASSGAGKYIQLRTSKNSGIVTTATGGKLKEIKIEFNTGTSNNRAVDIYGSNTAYESMNNLFNTTSAGTKIATATKTSTSTSTTIQVTDSYEYIGIRSNDGALYIDKITIVWETSGSNLTSTTTSFGDNSKKTFNFVNGVLEGFTAPTATAKAGDTDLTSKLVYSSSDEDIVTVAQDGTLNFTNTKFGDATIKAEIVKDDTYDTSSDTYTIVNAEPAKTATSLSFGTDKDGSTVALTEGLLSDGSDFAGYTATESTGAAGTISYAATGDGVATVDATSGALTINKTTYGTTTITATFTPTDTETYATSTAKYTITNAEKVDLSEIIFDVAKDKTSKQATGKDELAKGIVTISSTSAALGGYGDYRLYSGSKTTFSLSDANRVITSIKFEGGTQYSKLTADKGTYTQSTGLWEGKEATVVFTASTAIKNITKITITTAEKKESPAPALSFANPTEEIELKEGLVYIQAITKPADLDEKAVTYVSSDNTIAEVTEGLITLKKTGEVTIKATSAATDNYAAGSAEYTLKVVDTRADAQISVKEESVDVELSTESYNPADNINNPNNVKLTYASSNADITINEETGKIAFTKVGSTIVTVSFAGDNSYKPFETSFTLNVVDTRATEAPISIKEQTVTVQLPTDEYYASTNVTNDQKLTLTYAIDNKDFEIDETSGFVAFDKVGSATITVSFAGDKTYKPFTGTFTLNVEESRTTDAAFKFDAESYTLDLADGKAEFDANAKLQNPNNLTYTWEISPMTNGESIDASGKATGLKRGTYTITATSTTNKNYLATTATCTLEVTNSAVDVLTVEFEAGKDKGKTTNTSADEMSKGFITISSGSAALGRSDEYRLYASTHTISTKIGTITKIKFENSDSDNPVSRLLYKGEDGTYDSGIWTGSAKEVVFTNNSQVRTTNIIVTLELPVAKSYTLDEATTDNVIESYENANVTLKRTLSASYWNTFCVPFALDADEVKQYFGEGTELRTYEGNCADNVVNFTVVDNIEAGKPYIMKPGTAVVTDPEFKNVVMVADDLDTNGNPQAVGATTSVQMKGIYNHVTLEQKETNIFLGDGDKFYYPADAEDCEMDGLRAYFIVPEGTDLKKLRANLDGTATSLGAIFGTEETSAAVYNLQGLYVGNSLKQLKSGVYIQNGKKIVVK